jgi:hypothetical protein
VCRQRHQPPRLCPALDGQIALRRAALEHEARRVADAGVSLGVAHQQHRALCSARPCWPPDPDACEEVTAKQRHGGAPSAAAQRTPQIRLRRAAGGAPLRGSGEAASGVGHSFKRAAVSVRPAPAPRATPRAPRYPRLRA